MQQNSVQLHITTAAPRKDHHLHLDKLFVIAMIQEIGEKRKFMAYYHTGRTTCVWLMELRVAARRAMAASQVNRHLSGQTVM